MARSRAARVAALVLVLASLVSAQDAGPRPSPEALNRAAWETHRLCLAGARATRFLRHYEAADAAARQRAVEVLERDRPVPAGASWAVGIDTLRRAESVLADESGVPHDDPVAAELDALAGALDLVVIPGAFEVRSEGLGDPMTAYVRRVYPVAPRTDFVLSLAWRGPDGQEVHARREPVGPAAVTEDGFEMYLRSPLAGAGAWSLYGVVGRPASGELAGVVTEVSVDCVENLRERVGAALAKDLPGQPGLFQLRIGLDRLLRSGRHSSVSLGVNAMLRAIESWSEQGPAPGLPVPLELGFTDARAVEHWVWTYGPHAEPQRALLLLAPISEPVDFVFSGPIGQRWMELAERRKLQLFAAHAPPVPTHILPLLERLRQWVDGRPLVVVARGDALGRMHLGLSGVDPLPIEAVAISAWIQGGRPDELFGELPRLVAAPGASRASAPRYQGLEGAEFPLLNDIDLPRWVDAWLERLEAERAQSDGGK